MATVVELPRLSDTMEEGVIAKWHIAEGDKVKRGQVIAEIETDKATMEFESFDAGTVLRLVAPEGETLPLGAPIAVLGKPGEDADEVLSGSNGKGKGKARKAKGDSEADEDADEKNEKAPKAKKAKKATKAKPAKKGKKAKKPESDEEAVSEPDQEEAEAEVEEEGETGEASEDEGDVRQRHAPPPPTERETDRSKGREDDDRVAASPLARRLAREHGLSLSEIEGSGPHGRVVKEDVEKAAAKGPKPGAPAAVEAPAREDERLKLSQMRKTIAKRMAKANAEIPHFYLTTEVAMDNAVAMREQLKAALPDVKISYNDLIVLGAVKALQRHPEVNAFWDGETIVLRGAIHLGIAVAIDEGLIVPVIDNADRKTLSQIATQARDLGTRARDKKLSPKEMSGSTFTVSNLGMFGITEFSAVINPGEGAILSVGAIVERPVVRDGQLVVGNTMKMTLACDHRVMDGATGAKFLATLRSLLEQPLAMLA